MQEKNLRALKVVELKARCKDWKVPNYSKLNKAELIQQILVHDRLSLDLQHPVDTGLEPSKQRSSSSEAQNTSKRSRTSLASQLISTNIDRDSTRQASPLAPTVALTPSTAFREANILRTVPSSSLVTSTNTNDHTFRCPTAKTRSDKVRPLLIKSTFQKSTFKAPAPREHSHRVAQHDFQTVNYLVIPAMELTSDRVAYIRSHFLNRLMTNLNKHRSLSSHSRRTDPKSETADDVTSILAFRGIDQSIYGKGTAEDFAVAIRFWLFRLHVLMQLGCGEGWSSYGNGMGLPSPDLSSWPVVTSCKQISQHFWSIQTTASQSDSAVTTFLVLGLTGEVLGTSTGQQNSHKIEGCGARLDWYNFIARTPVGAASPTELLDQIKTKNDVDYPHGISRAWKTRVKDIVMVRIAQRVVAASVVLNR
ncbi:hypothetical protein CI109_104773 [Kwoniella shandongensis]|uniref:Uncharacterized protein n=1 Tax=Kwoniella shandongensis TaxID=1734106 RepID=A0A5M6BUK3_9TREE|nr:uncharacterized protein CI109_007012 [Kwoniella shandongensis]KAA5524689.1 hypothetical protein CI109_007012 [Kwoniella shandongensis]